MKEIRKDEKITEKDLKIEKESINKNSFFKKIIFCFFSNKINILIIVLIIISEIFRLNQKYKINLRKLLILLLILNTMIKYILDIKYYFKEKKNKETEKEKLKNLEKENNTNLETQYSTLNTENESPIKLKSKHVKLNSNEKNKKELNDEKNDFETLNSSIQGSERDSGKNFFKQNKIKGIKLFRDTENKKINSLNEYSIKLKCYFFTKILCHVGYHFNQRKLYDHFIKWKKNAGIKIYEK